MQNLVYMVTKVKIRSKKSFMLQKSVCFSLMKTRLLRLRILDLWMKSGNGQKKKAPLFMKERTWSLFPSFVAMDVMAIFVS